MYSPKDKPFREGTATQDATLKAPNTPGVGYPRLPTMSPSPLAKTSHAKDIEQDTQQEVLTQQDIDRLIKRMSKIPFPDDLNETVIPSAGQPTGIDRASTPWQIVNQKQLSYAVQEDAGAVMDMINQLRIFFDQARHEAVITEETIEKYMNTISVNQALTNRLQDQYKEQDTDSENESPKQTKQRTKKMHTSNVHKPKDPLKNVPVFSGEPDSKVDYEVWKNSVFRNFSADTNQGLDETDQITHLMNKLSGTAALHCLPRCKISSKRLFEDINDVVDHLDHRFEDHDKPANNRRRYKELRQGKR
jgi:hypothetical protein